MTEWLPHLSPAVLVALRGGYGALLVLMLLWAWPQRSRFFLGDRWGGYAERGIVADVMHHPLVMPLVQAVWMATAGALVAGVVVVPAAVVNVCLCRYFFVHMRWKGLLRGMGAPGFMTYWLGVVVVLLEVTTRYAPDQQPLAIWVAQVDFALIMLSAGLYKATAGYATGEGMDYGMANPQWGYWWRWCRRLSPRGVTLRWLNHAAWLTEVLAAILMLIPAARLPGGLLIAASFVFVLTQIRLGWLCELVIVCTLLFVPAGHAADVWIASWLGTPAAAAPVPLAAVSSILVVVLWVYLALLPLAHMGLFYNFYARRRLPAAAQWALERYTNLFGIIIWRVFSVDHLNFFIRIHHQWPDGTRTLVSRYGSWRAVRFMHVAESIVVTTIFTALKYYPSQPGLFQDRLRRYARTVPRPPGAQLVFEYVAVRKRDHYAFDPVVEYHVDPVTGRTTTVPLDPAFDVHAAALASVVHENAAPGTYAPAGR